MKKDISRQAIQRLLRHSDWSAEDAEKAYQEQSLTASARDWQQFLNEFLLGLGLLLSISGVVFFFAYNWADLHKFVKLGIVQIIMLGLVSAAYYWRDHKLYSRMLLTGAALSVGAMFAVFGQVYQTGADAFDFFLGWTVFIGLWVLVSSFSPLWFVGIALLNVMLVSYFDQISTDTNPIIVWLCFFILNGIILSALEYYYYKKINTKTPHWLIGCLTILTYVCLTCAFIYVIFQTEEWTFILTVGAALFAFPIGIWWAYFQKKILYIAVIFSSLLAIIAALIIRPFKFEENPYFLFLLVSALVIAGTTLIIQYIIRLNKKWNESI